MALPRKAKPGTAGTRAFLTDRSGRVTWCRLVGRTAACAELSPSASRWETGRSTRTARSLQADNRTWVSLAVGPALCGRAGTVRQQRLACQVLTIAGWRTSASHVASWGNAGYRAFVPSGSGVAFCRTVPARKNGSALSCTPMSKLEWGATHTSQRVPLALPDPSDRWSVRPCVATSACASRASGLGSVVRRAAAARRASRRSLHPRPPVPDLGVDVARHA